MKFSITIDTGYRDIPKEEKKKLRQEKLKTELKKGIDNTSKLLAAGFEAAKKQIPALRRIADEISDEVKTDIAAVRERDPAARNDLEVLMLYSGVHAILAYRVAHKLYLGKKYFPARAVSQFAKFITGIEIHPGATIGKGLVIDHGSGVVIGETAEIGDNCTLYQGVTLGGTGKDTGKRHPTLGNNVMVGAGAKVLGPFRIGDNSKIAAGAVVLSEIPANSTAVGIPARVVRRDGIRVMSCEEELDQVHLPDPVAQQLCRLEARCARLEAELTELHASRENAENESGDKESS